MQGVPEEQVQDFDVQDVQEQEVVNEVSEGQVSIFDDDLSEAMIDQSLARQRLQEALENEKPKKKKKSMITNLIFLAINLCILGFIIYSCVGKASGVPLGEIFEQQGKRMWWLVAGVGLFVLMFFADTMMFYCLIKRSTGKRRFGVAYKVSAVGKYFDYITPFSVGGQPSQIMNLTRAGLSPGIATSIPIIKLIIYNIVYTIIILGCLIFAVPFIPITSSLNHLLFNLLKFFAYLGLIFTAITSVAFILIGSGKIVGRSLVRWVVRLGYKLRLVKDYRKSYNKIMNQVLEYQSSMKYLRNNKGTLFACIFFAIIDIFAYFAVPFTVVMALTPANIVGTEAVLSTLLICITQFIICQMAAVVIPLPGGTGMMEFSFIALFGVSSLIGNANIMWGLLAWRFLTYYFTIIQGFIVSTIDNIRRMIKNKKEQKLEASQAAAEQQAPPPPSENS